MPDLHNHQQGGATRRSLLKILGLVLIASALGSVAALATVSACTQYAIFSSDTLVTIPLVVALGTLIAPLLVFALVFVGDGASLVVAVPLLVTLGLAVLLSIGLYRRIRSKQPAAVIAASLAILVALFAWIVTFGFCVSLSA